MVDYLIKLGLDAASLEASVHRGLERLAQLKASEAYRREEGRPLLQSYHDKFFMRLIHNLLDSREQFQIQARDLKLDFFDRCYLSSHEVADQLGFESAFYFSKVFKKVEGISPREYIQSHMELPDLPDDHS